MVRFSSADSWVILTGIEQRIKEKIESIGTPLKDWNIQINYGIKTGLNDAFVISTEKRDEILEKCTSEDERNRTADIIRPILRGRDIKRYGHDWANLWLINTHNGVKGRMPRIEIEEFPAIKAHLDKYWDKIRTRADKGDTPYNLRNCAYLEDFDKPKVMWKIIGCNINFAYDDSGILCNNAVDIITGEASLLLQFIGLMNSKLFDWYLKITTEAEVQGGGIQLYVTTLEKTLLKLNFEQKFTEAVENRVKGIITDQELDNIVFNLYHLTPEEIDCVLSSDKVNRN